MILLEESKYNETIAILRNQKKLPEIFSELRELMNNQFRINAVNFTYEKIPYNNPENRYRLEVLLRNKGDYTKMCDGPYGGYKKNRQKFIADKFYELAIKYSVDDLEHIKDIWVCYNNFHAELSAEANRLASAEAIAFIKEKYKEVPIWQIYQQFSGGVVFYQTDSQVKEYEQNGISEKIKKDYFTILKEYDEFECFDDADNFLLSFDSSELLERVYNGNLYQYFK